MSKNTDKSSSKKELIIKIVSIISIIIVIFITYIFVSNLNTIKITTEEHELFQYILGEKAEYVGKLEISNKNNITKLESESETLYIDSVPIYYKSEFDKVILPSAMSAVFPMENGKLNKVNSLSTVYINRGDVYIQKEELNRQLNDAFLYDGNDVYFFIENTKVTVDNTEYKLSPLSYVNATYKGYVEIYNYDKDECIFIEDVNDDIIATTNDYSINLSKDTMKYEEKEQILLKRIKDLPNLEN